MIFSGEPTKALTHVYLMDNQITAQLKHNGNPNQVVKVSKAYLHKDPTTETSELASPFTITELEVALKFLQIGKAVGINDIRNEILKNSRDKPST